MTRSICVVGAGIVGTNLARAFTSAGHHVVLGARDLSSDKTVAARDELGIDVVPLEHAAGGRDVVVLAVPYPAVADTVAALGDIGDTVLVDATNTVGTTLPDGATSILDVIGRTNPSATLVKGFNTIGAEAFVKPTIDADPTRAGTVTHRQGPDVHPAGCRQRPGHDVGGLEHGAVVAPARRVS